MQIAQNNLVHEKIESIMAEIWSLDCEGPNTAMKLIWNYFGCI